MGSQDTAHGVPRLSLYLLDPSVLIAHMRGDAAVTSLLLDLLADRHLLGTSCVNVAEVERGIRSKERKAADALLTRLPGELARFRPGPLPLRRRSVSPVDDPEDRRGARFYQVEHESGAAGRVPRRPAPSA